MFSLLKTLAFASLVAGSALSPRANGNSSTFVYQSDGADGADFVLSVTAVADTGDLWFRLNAPAVYDWVAFGIGAQMKGALTFIVYPSKNGSALELSPRLSTGNTEPAYNSKINATKIYLANDPSANHVDPSTVGESGMIAISGVCYNCTNWSNPPLDLTSTAAPFLFAVGPISDGTSARWSNLPDAPLRRHTLYGQFSMDMTKATVQSGNGSLVPTMSNATNGAHETAPVGIMMHDYPSTWHALLMCLVVAIIIPFDSMLLRLFHKTLIHYILEAISMIFLIIGLGLGFYISTWFVRSRQFSSPHQVLGYLTLIVLLAQIPIGLLWRTPKLRGEQPARWVKLSHQILTGLFWVLAVVDASLGFTLALQPGYNKAWVALIVAVALLYLFAFGARACFTGHRKDSAEAIRLEQATSDVYKQAQQIAATQYNQPQYAQPQYYGGYDAQAPYANGAPIELQHYGGHPEPGVQYVNVQVPKTY